MLGEVGCRQAPEGAAVGILLGEALAAVLRDLAGDEVFVFNRSCAGIASGTEQRKQRQLSRLRT